MTIPDQDLVTAIDHITIPSSDLRIAEQFYVGLLRATVRMRIDEEKLVSLGWPLDTIRAYRAPHLSLTLGTGPRIDIFEYPEGNPRAPMHPHLAFAVPGDAFPRWLDRLRAHQVPIAGPTRLGIPGQASCYFNDPDGNHLELLTYDYTDEELPLGLPTGRDNLEHPWTSVSSRGVWTPHNG
jgi:catechol 2,3-dioxygenase-like lactoylglutathione lyase family enzyme